MSTWGVDSALSIKNIPLTLLLKKPDFWMRYLNPIDGVSGPLSIDEINYAHQNGITIGFVYSGFNQHVLENDGTAGLGDTVDLLLRALNVQSRNYVVFLDMEADINGSVLAIQQYCIECKSHFITPGLYFNSNEEQHVKCALEVLRNGGLLWDSEPQDSQWNGTVITYEQSQTRLLPYRSGTKPGLRQYANNQVRGMVDFDTCDDITFQYMYHPRTELLLHDKILHTIQNLQAVRSTIDDTIKEMESWV